MEREITVMKYEISAFADEYSDDFDEQIDVLKKLGIPNLEIRYADGKSVADFTEKEVFEYASKIRGNGLKVSSIGSPIGKAPIDGDLEAHFSLAEKIFDMANEFETEYVRVFSFYIPKGEDPKRYRSAVFGAAEKLLTLADKYGVTLCHENEAYIYGENPQNCRDLLDYFGGRMKCVFDMGNFVLDGYDPYDAYELLSPYIAYFHIKDALYEGAVVPAGRGDAKIAQILLSHRKFSRKSCFVTLEPHLQTFGGLNALVGKSFDNPYKYKNRQEAFLDAFAQLKKILIKDQTEK